VIVCFDLKKISKVNRTSNVVKRFTKFLEDKYPDVPPEVVKKFSRLRTFVRLKELNKEVREEQLTRRNAKQLQQFRTWGERKLISFDIVK